MSSILQSLDIYRIKPKFFIKKAESIPSILGGVLSIITIILSLVIVIYSMSEVFGRVNYTTSFKQEFQKFYSSDLSEKSIFFNVLTDIKYEHPNLDRILNFYPTYNIFNVSATQNDRIISFPIETIKCTGNENGLKDTILPSGLPINKFNCLMGLKSNNSIFGQLGSYGGFSYIEINFFRCSNSTNNNNHCFSNEMIDYYLRDMLLIWGTLDYDIDNELHGNPFVPQVFTEGFKISKELYNMIRVKNKKVEYISDTGLISNNIETFVYSLHDITEVQTYNLSDDYPNLFKSLIIETSGKREIHTRKYQRIQEALAIVSAVLNFMKILCGIFVDLNEDKIYFEYLINYLLSSKAEYKQNGIRRKDDFLQDKSKLGFENESSFNKINNSPIKFVDNNFSELKRASNKNLKFEKFSRNKFHYNQAFDPINISEELKEPKKLFKNK